MEDGFSKLAFDPRKLRSIDSFCINLYDKEKLIATVGSIYYGRMYIDTLFVDDKFRNQQLGKKQPS